MMMMMMMITMTMTMMIMSYDFLNNRQKLKQKRISGYATSKAIIDT